MLKDSRVKEFGKFCPFFRFTCLTHYFPSLFYSEHVFLQTSLKNVEHIRINDALYHYFVFLLLNWFGLILKFQDFVSVAGFKFFLYSLF